MVRMIPYPEPPPDDRGHPAGGPEICRVAMGRRPLRQGAEQPRLLPGRELRRAPRRRFGGQGRRPPSAGGLPPQVDRTDGTPHALRHRRQGETTVEQLEGPAAAALQVLGTPMRSHADRIAQHHRFFYYLCVTQ
jgi:hypothetical protein